MRLARAAALTLSIGLLAEAGRPARYEANWTSLDARPLPRWYDDAKIGIFVHWGVFSVPAFGKFSEWLWYYWHDAAQAQVVDFIKNNYPPGWKYADFAPQFHAEFFDPDAWAELFEASGAGYDKHVYLKSKLCVREVRRDKGYQLPDRQVFQHASLFFYSTRFTRER